MRPREQLVSEGLRRLGEDDARAVEAFDEAVAFAPLHRVTWSDRGERRPRLDRGRKHTSHQRGRRERARGIVHENVIAFAERGQAGPHGCLPALASRLHDHRLARVQRCHLALRILEPARWSDDHDPVYLVQRQEQFQHARQRRPAVELDQRLAPAAEPRAGARRRDDRSHRQSRPAPLAWPGCSAAARWCRPAPQRSSGRLTFGSLR